MSNVPYWFKRILSINTREHKDNWKEVVEPSLKNLKREEYLLLREELYKSLPKRLIDGITEEFGDPINLVYYKEVHHFDIYGYYSILYANYERKIELMMAIKSLESNDKVAKLYSHTIFHRCMRYEGHVNDKYYCNLFLNEFDKSYPNNEEIAEYINDALALLEIDLLNMVVKARKKLNNYTKIRSQKIAKAIREEAELTQKRLNFFNQLSLCIEGSPLKVKNIIKILKNESTIVNDYFFDDFEELIVLKNESQRQKYILLFDVFKITHSELQSEEEYNKVRSKAKNKTEQTYDDYKYNKVRYLIKGRKMNKKK